MAAGYPAKHWWVVLVLVPLGVAIIAVVPGFLGTGDVGDRG